MTSIAFDEAQLELPPDEAPLVLVATEDRGVRARIVDALARSDLRVRGVASAHEVPAQELAPQLFIVHSEAVGSDLLASLRDLRRRRGGMPLMLVCDSANGLRARRALDGGVDGIVFVEQIERALAPTVASVLAGQTSVPSQARGSIRRSPLSYREKQILAMVVMGLTNSQIGARLFLAESTVKSHLSSAFTKLGVRSRSEAAALILDPEEPQGASILATLDPHDGIRIAPAH